MCDERFEVVVHHSGSFVCHDNGKLDFEGETTKWFCDPDKWSYFEIVGGLKELGHINIKELWYSVGGGSVVEGRLELLTDDKGVMHMVNLARLNGVVHLYVVHKMTEPEIIKAIDGVQPGLEEIEEGTKFGCVGEGEQLQVEVEAGLEDIQEDDQFECGGEVDKEVGASNGLGEHEVQNDVGGGEHEVQDGVGGGEHVVDEEMEDGGEGRKENVDVYEEEEEDDVYVDDVLLVKDTESETFSDEGLIDVSIECEVHNDMEDDWVGDIECEVQKVSQQDGGSAKAKDRRKPQRSSRKNVKHQQSDSDSVEDSPVSDNEWHSDELISASDSGRIPLIKKVMIGFLRFLCQKKCMISNGK